MKKHALVVGVSKYEDKRITPVAFAAEDATEVSRCLQVDCKFDTVTLLVSKPDAIQPTGREILRQLSEDMRESVGADDLFLFYFAGHGLKNGVSSFVLPCDALDGNYKKTGLSLEDLRESIDGVGAGKYIEIYDSCRNNPLSARGIDNYTMDEQYSRDIKAVLLPKQEKKATEFWRIHACDEGEKAWDLAAKQQGVFTYHLLSGLRGKACNANGQVTLKGLSEYACSKTKEWARGNSKQQTPCSCLSESMHGFVLATPIGEYDAPPPLPHGLNVRELASSYSGMLVITCEKRLTTVADAKKRQLLKKITQELRNLAATANPSLAALHRIMGGVFDKGIRAGCPFRKDDWAPAEYAYLKWKDSTNPFFSRRRTS